MEETGILENPALLSLVLPDFEPGQENWCQFILSDRLTVNLADAANRGGGGSRNHNSLGDQIDPLRIAKGATPA
jgi:hypothetical protein